MKKLQIRTKYSREETPKRFETPKGKSKTVLGEARSIQELLERMVSGTFEDEKSNATYIDAEISQINKFYGQPLDLTDLDELRENNKQMLGEIEREIQSRVEEAEKETAEQSEATPEPDSEPPKTDTSVDE
ncbi:hypothetical protein [Microviridae sp.]|nr:hypothetical protein [Microviridae sp.]